MSPPCLLSDNVAGIDTSSLEGKRDNNGTDDGTGDVTLTWDHGDCIHSYKLEICMIDHRHVGSYWIF